MDKQLEEQIKELGKILNTKTTQITGSHEEVVGWYEYDGHQVGSPETEWVTDYETTYDFPEEERKEALRKLKKLRKSNKEREIRKLIDKELELTKKERQVKIHRTFKRIAISCGIASVLFFSVRWCINYSREREIRTYLEPQRIQLLLDHSWETKRAFQSTMKELRTPIYYLEDNLSRHKNIKENIDRELRYCEKKVKKYIEKGYITKNHPYYKDYKKLFGNLPWWPNDVNDK